MRSTTTAFIPAILAIHAESAASNWLLRDRAVSAPHFSLSTLGMLDDRIDGHLDGLRVAGPAGWDTYRAELDWAAAGSVFVASVSAFESRNSTRVREVVSVATETRERARELASALSWLPWELVQPYTDLLATADEAPARYAATAAYAIRRADPGCGLKRCLSDDAPIVRSRAFRAAGELQRRDVTMMVKEGLEEPDETCRFWSAYSVTLLGDRTALEILRQLAEGGGPVAARAALLAARAMPLSDALMWQRYLASVECSRRLAVEVAGAIGDPASIPWLLEQMERPSVARVAGEAFTTITGVDLANQDLAAGWPAGFEAGPNDSPLDENVGIDPDQDLAFPNPRLLSEWWLRNSFTLTPGVRHLAGQPITVLALEDTLRRAPQRIRTAAAVELTLRQSGRPLFEVRAPAAQQRAELGIYGTRP